MDGFRTALHALALYLEEEFAVCLPPAYFHMSRPAPPVAARGAYFPSVPVRMRGDGFAGGVFPCKAVHVAGGYAVHPASFYLLPGFRFHRQVLPVSVCLDLQHIRTGRISLIAAIGKECPPSPFLPRSRSFPGLRSPRARPRHSVSPDRCPR